MTALKASIDSAERSPAGSPIDIAHLKRQTLGDTALMREILGMFQEEASARMHALDQAASASDWLQAAHSLKGVARAIGAFDCAAVAERLEQSRWPLSGDVRHALMRQMSDALAFVHAAIDRLLDETA